MFAQLWRTGEMTSALSIKNDKRVGLAAGLLAVLAFVCFIPSLSVGFLSDDKQQFAYIYHYLHTQPLLLLQNFTSVWMQDPIWGLHYRPMMLIPLVFDTAVYQLNAVGSHVTTICLHVACTVLVFFLARALLKRLAQITSIVIPLLAGALFAVHPLHAESVIWICGRVDTFCTLFYIAGFLTFILSLDSERTSSRKLRILSLCFCFVSLFTKEVGATLPFIFTWYLFCANAARPSAGSENWRQTIFSAFKTTRMYWFLFALYLICRSLSLGTLYGGYEGFASVALNNVWLPGLLSWKYLRGVFFPVPLPQLEELGSAITALYILYGALLAVLIARIAFFRDRSLLRTLLFLSGWIIAGLALVARVWYAAGGLPGGRHFYLVSVPFCILFVLLFVPDTTKTKVERKLKQLAIGVISVYCLLFGALTVKTHELWLDESKYEAAIESGIVRLSEENPQATRLVFLAAPMTHQHLALYPSFANLQGCLKAPFCKPELSEKIAAMRAHFFNLDLVNSSELKKILATPNTVVFGWDGDKREIVKIPSDYFGNDSDSTSFARDVKLKLQSHVENIATYFFEIGSDFKKGLYDCLEVTAVTPIIASNESAAMVLSWNERKDSMNKGVLPLYKLVNGTRSLWRLDDTDGFASKLSVFLEPDGKTHKYRFNLSEIASWVLLANPAELQLLVTPGKTKIESVRFLNLNAEIPKLYAPPERWTREQSGRMSPKSRGSIVLKFDATMIKGANYVMAEISRPFEYFEYFEPTFRQVVMSPRSMKKYSLEGLKGQMELWPDDFKVRGEYDVRIAAFDKDGKLLGYVSDPVTLHI